MKRIASFVALVVAICTLFACEPPYSATRVVGANDDLAFGVEPPDTTPPKIEKVVVLPGMNWVGILVTPNKPGILEGLMNDPLHRAIRQSYDGTAPVKWTVEGLVANTSYGFALTFTDERGKWVVEEYQFTTMPPPLMIYNPANRLDDHGFTLMFKVSQPCEYQVGLATAGDGGEDPKTLTYSEGPVGRGQVTDPAQEVADSFGAVPAWWYIRIRAWVASTGEEATPLYFNFIVPARQEFKMSLLVQRHNLRDLFFGIFVPRPATGTVEYWGQFGYRFQTFPEANIWHEMLAQDLPPGTLHYKVTMREEGGPGVAVEEKDYDFQ